MFIGVMGVELELEAAGKRHECEIALEGEIWPDKDVDVSDDDDDDGKDCC